MDMKEMPEALYAFDTGRPSLLQWGRHRDGGKELMIRQDEICACQAAPHYVTNDMAVGGRWDGFGLGSLVRRRWLETAAPFGPWLPAFDYLHDSRRLDILPGLDFGS